ncbi:BT4734/BF3469 family protein [Bacteroides ndongoniae]|uniref:BT4734/BF3469 family protein n=1 Tax=Bacteroides ndongoniae TaxID=1903262 RepID=UPI0008DAEFD1|nr:BT4734/BF3469 family protein [Bacteroides ndongoniae]
MLNSIMSFFNAPVSNKVPTGVCNVQGLYEYITTNPRLRELTEQVRSVADDKQEYRRRKLAWLPYVTPAGVFSYCKGSGLLVPSGLLVVDIDHLASLKEAEDCRDRLAADPMLNPDLAFVSPGGRGVKLFLSYRIMPEETLSQTFGNAVQAAWSYLELQYGLQPDKANKDLCRGCLLAYDEEAKRMKN